MHINCLPDIHCCNRHHAVVRVGLLDSLSRRNFMPAMACCYNQASSSATISCKATRGTVSMSRVSSRRVLTA
jgi:hypothetical protein